MIRVRKPWAVATPCRCMLPLGSPAFPEELGVGSCGSNITGLEAQMAAWTHKGSTKTLLLILGSLVPISFFMVQFAAAQGATFKGEITDEHLYCIQTPVKAVEGITKKEGCVLYWTHFAKPPSKYVLYDAATRTAYQLDDQRNVQPYVGETVQITGTLNAAT